MEEGDFYQEIPLPEVDERLVRPFEHLEVPPDDDATLVSAITHESNALFVTSMYPSLQGVGDDHDDGPQLKPLPPLVENEEEKYEEQPSLQQSEAAILKGIQAKGISKTPRHENPKALHQNEEPPELLMKVTLNEDKFQEGDGHSDSAMEKDSSVSPLLKSDAASQVSMIPGAYEVAGPGQDPGTQNVGRQIDAERPFPARPALIDSQPNSIAVAIPVDEDDNLKPTQIANPADEKGNEARENSQKIYAGAFLGALILTSGILIGSICGSGLCSNSGAAQSSTQAPTTFRDNLAPAIQKNLEASLGLNYFADESQSPNILAQRQKALEWMVHEDPLQLEPDADILLQRFVLAAFYYLTTQQRPWTYCNPPNETQGDTCIFRSLNVPGVDEYGTRWLSGTSECTWRGVLCRKGVVEELSLSLSDAHGQIPTELVMLNLSDLFLAGNEFTGNVPVGVQLTSLNLAANQLSGTIPASLFQLSPNLTWVSLYQNNLTGSLPSEVGLHPKEYLFLHQNQLSGTLPSELFGLEMLKSMSLADNKITGTLSTLIGKLSSGSLLFGKNMLTGIIPSEVALVQRLGEFDVSHTMMQGTIPDELYTGSASLTWLFLDGCQFSGTISTEIGLLTKLVALGLAANNFHGTIPEELSAVSSLVKIQLNGNNFTGTVPEGICTNLPANRGWTVVADCAPNTSTGITTMPCQCCTECCDRETGICVEQ